MKVNELIKNLQESVNENAEVGDWQVYMNPDCEGDGIVDYIHINNAFKYVDLETD